MLRIEFTLKSSLIQKKILFSSAASLVLTFLEQINKINYVSSIYVIGLVLLGKIEQLKYALSISAAGCVFDLFYLIFHSSNKNKILLLALLINNAILVQVGLISDAFSLLYICLIVWITGVYCYLKQEEAIKDQTKTNWFGKQMGRFLPGKFGLSSGSDQPSTSNEPPPETTASTKSRNVSPTPKAKPKSPDANPTTEKTESDPQPEENEESTIIEEQIADKPSKTDDKQKEDKS